MYSSNIPSLSIYHCPFLSLPCLLSDTATQATDGRHSSRSVRSTQVSPLIVEPSTHSSASQGKFNKITKTVGPDFILIYLDITYVFLIQRSHSCNISNNILFFLRFFCLPAEETAGQLSSRASVPSNAASERGPTVSEGSGSNSPDPLESAVTEMFISEENISKMENILETWSNNLKVSVLSHTVELSLHTQSM